MKLRLEKYIDARIISIKMTPRLICLVSEIFNPSGVSLLLACLSACGGDDADVPDEIVPLSLDSRINIIPAN